MSTGDSYGGTNINAAFELIIEFSEDDVTVGVDGYDVVVGPLWMRAYFDDRFCVVKVGVMIRE